MKTQVGMFLFFLLCDLVISNSCWFETDEEFSARCSKEREIGKAKYKNPKKTVLKTSSKSGAGTGRTGAEGKSSSTASNWSTIGQKKPVTKPTLRQSAPSSGFAAAFGGDSDDDS